jgi:hypothetical protein
MANVDIKGWRVMPTFYRHRGSTKFTQVVLPPELRDRMLHEAHTGMTGGHLGLKKTLDQIQRRAYWIDWRQRTALYCRRCPECATYHRGRLPHAAPMQEMVIGAPFERVGIDLTGPHPRSKRGFTYILTYVDHFTKWAEAIPLRNKEACTVTDALLTEIFPRLGLPRQILSDNGREFRNQVLNELSARLNVDRIFTTAYSPSTNGITERLHRTINSMLAKVVTNNQRDWCERLPFVMAAYRSAVHSATGYSPNFLVFGRELNAPIDLMLGRPEDVEYHSVAEYVEDKLSKIEWAHNLARETLQTNSARNKIQYDVRVRPQNIEVGEWVWYYSPRRYAGLSAKFQRNYSGPFLVIRRLSPVLLVIQKSLRSKEILAHADKLKPCLGEHPPSWLDHATSVDDPTQAPTNPLSRETSNGEDERPAPHTAPLRVEAPPFIPRKLNAPLVPTPLPETSQDREQPEPASRPRRSAGLPMRYRP